MQAFCALRPHRALAQGISPQVFDRAFRNARYDPDVISKDRNQAEFKSQIWDYLDNAVAPPRVSEGQAALRKHRRLLNRIEAAYGVEAEVVVAVWGLESRYGTRMGDTPMIDAMATLAFDGRRGKFFESQLIAALKILQSGEVSAPDLKGSWAGAMGHTQFIPTSYQSFAVDFTGDGRRDIWGSQADTFASISAYLVGHGWVKGRDWGFEVKLPKSLSCTLEGPDQARSIAEWADLGITRVSGRPFPDHELRGKGSLMLPAGRNGPAFLVTPNFYVLKDYNFSDLYALFVGHVGDRLQYNMTDFRGSWGKFSKMYRSDIARMQRALENKGYDVGGADGLIGFKTRRSVGQWQERNGKRATCFPDANLIKALAR